jgi:hypothetical protein
MISIDVSACESLTCGGLQDFYKAARGPSVSACSTTTYGDQLVAQKLDSFLDFRIHAQATLAAIFNLAELLRAGDIVPVGIIHGASINPLLFDSFRLIREPH